MSIFDLNCYAAILVNVIHTYTLLLVCYVFVIIFYNLYNIHVVLPDPAVDINIVLTSLSKFI